MFSGIDKSNHTAHRMAEQEQGHAFGQCMAGPVDHLVKVVRVFAEMPDMPALAVALSVAPVIEGEYRDAHGCQAFGKAGISPAVLAKAVSDQQPCTGGFDANPPEKQAGAVCGMNMVRDFRNFARHEFHLPCEDDQIRKIITAFLAAGKRIVGYMPYFPTMAMEQMF